LEPGDRCLAGAHPSCQLALAQTSRFPGCSDPLAQVGCESRLRVRLVVLCPLGLVHGRAASLTHFCPGGPRHRSPSSALWPSLIHRAMAALARAISPSRSSFAWNSVSRTSRPSPAKKWVILWAI